MNGFRSRHNLILIGICLLATACDFNFSKKEKFPSVKAAKPEIVKSPLKLHYIGLTKSIRRVDIKARVDGYLEERFFKDGDIVKEGQLLYQIDEKPYQAEVLSNQGDVDKATSDLAFQDLQYKRYAELVAKKTISKSSFDQQYSSYLSAKGQLESAQGRLKKSEINLGYCRINSPLNGMAGKNLVDPGNLVSATNHTLLLTVVQLDPMRVEFNPVASDLKLFSQYEKYKPFQAEISLSKYPNRSWNGVVDFYNNEVTQLTSTILLRTTILNPDYTLRPDLYVDVAVVLDPFHKFTLVPVVMLKEVQGLFQIRVIDTSHHIQVRTVVPGQIMGEKIEIQSGLKKDDLILMDNLTLPTGTEVTPIFNQQVKQS
jgi:RND family efflux transporter MFP subunit